MNVGFRVPTRVDTEPVERPFDLRQYLNFLWRRWTFIASVTGLALLIAVIHLARATPLYTATSQVLLERAERAPVDTSPTPYYSYYDQQSFFENQLAIIKSDPQLRDIPVLILTTSREKRDIDLTKQAGASSFLAKPEVFEDLTEMLEKFCTAILDNPNIPFQVIGC